jgi:chemotaxis protein methyltransferase CheR
MLKTPLENQYWRGDPTPPTIPLSRLKLYDAFDLNAYVRPPASMSSAELEGFSKLIHDEIGIKLSQAKRHMVTARLSKRLRILNIESYAEYLNLLRNPSTKAQELDEFIDVMTTNKTEFFRERGHYTAMVNLVVPKLRSLLDPTETLNVWSAACSTGEEPYSIAMLLYDHMRVDPTSFSILATDVCKDALARARKAVYTSECIRPIPIDLATRFLMRGKGNRRGFYRIVPEIRNYVEFQRLNLMDESYSLNRPLHMIWCRNVMIYFDTPTKIELAKKLYRQLIPGGYLFIGHSESLNGLSSEFQPVLPSVYRKPLGVNR